MIEEDLTNAFFGILQNADAATQNAVMTEIFEHFQKEGIFTEEEAHEGITTFIKSESPSDEILDKFAHLICGNKFHLCNDDERGIRVDYTPINEEELAAVADCSDCSHDEDFMKHVLSSASIEDVMQALGRMAITEENGVSSETEAMLRAIQGFYGTPLYNSNARTKPALPGMSSIVEASTYNDVLCTIAKNIGSTPEKVRCLAVLKGYDDRKVFAIGDLPTIAQEFAFDPVITEARQFFDGIYNELSHDEQIATISEIMAKMVECGAFTQAECDAGITEVWNTYGIELRNYKAAENPHIAEMVHQFNTGKLELFAKIGFDKCGKPYFDITISNGDKFNIFFDNLTHMKQDAQVRCMSTILETLAAASLFTENEADEALTTFMLGQPLRQELIDRFANLVRCGYVDLKEEKVNGNRKLNLTWDTSKYDPTKGFSCDVKYLNEEEQNESELKALNKIAGNLGMKSEELYALSKLKGYSLEQIVALSEVNIGAQYDVFVPFFMDFKQFLNGIGQILDKSTQRQIVTEIIERMYYEDMFDDEQYEATLVDIEDMFGDNGSGIEGDHLMLIKMAHKFITGQAKLFAHVGFDEESCLQGRIEITGRDAFELFMESLNHMDKISQIDCVTKIFTKMFEDKLVTEAERDEGINSFIEHRQMDDTLAEKFVGLVRKDYVSLFPSEGKEGVTLAFAKRW